ncbi:MAG: BREX-1 system phosphatase PglZ type A [Acidobacteriota bacterium]
MDTRQINDALSRIFSEEGKRIVFWNDPDREFVSVLPDLALEGVNIVRLDEAGALEVKIRVERADPEGRYLLYSPAEEPDFEDDWLLDIRLYSRSFRADRASILLNELGLVNQHLRQHLADRRKFFDNKERLHRLKSLVAANDIEADLDRKMISVVAKADQPELFNLVRTLFHAYADRDDEIDLDSVLPVWEQIEKYDLADSFWQMVKAAFGYEDEMPNLKKMLIRLMVTDYSHYLKADLPAALHHLVLPPPGRANAIVCLAQWRDSSSRASSYDRLSGEVAELIGLKEQLHNLDIDDLIEVMTFLEVEKRLVSKLRERVQQTAETINADEAREIATKRQAGYWASMTVSGSQEVSREALHAVYDALVHAGEFFSLRNEYKSGFDFSDASTMYRAYEGKLYRFDQIYRHFCEAADQAEEQGWHLLKPLRDQIEACYVNWYMPQIALVWGKFIEPSDGRSLLTKWQIDQVANQYRFYVRHVQSRLDEAENRRVFVIISDAFRYEAAEELSRELNGKYRLESALSSQLGVLPSYTALGMASLLPHNAIDFKGDDVLIDGKSTGGLEKRNIILQSVSGLACKAEELMAMKKDEGREYVSSKRVVYVYHSTVDDIGDKEATESKTFEAVRMAINELASLVGYIINNLNGNYILVTADHGFLFTETAPGEPDKSKMVEKPEGTVRAKKRYVIGYNLPDNDTVWHGKTAVTAGAEGEMEFWIPKGANRFHFVGGARFIHGGAMLQEIVVPVIAVKHRKDKSVRSVTKVKPVMVQVLGTSHKITTNRHRFELIQTEPVSDRVKPITFKVAVYEGEEPVTNIETVTFDSASDKMDDRRKWVHLVLQDREYDKKTLYRLVLRDVETGIEQQSVPVIIDRAFTDDF